MTEKPKPSQIANINQQIDKIKQLISEGNVQIKKYIEKRNHLHEQVKKSREEINQLKAERDGLNEKVKSLKQLRDAVRVNTVPITDEVNKLKEKIAELKKTLPRVSQRQLQEELDAVEWKIATTSVDLKEERELVDQVKGLEIQLSGYRKIDAQYKKIKELIEHRKTFDAQADIDHQELTDLAKKSQDLHATVIQKIEAMKKDKAEADSMHQAFIKTKEENNLLYAQVRLLIDQTEDLRIVARAQDQAMWIEEAGKRKEESAKRKEDYAKRQEEQAQRAVKEKEIKEKIGSQAREKLQRGEKVNWDEFQMMLGEGKNEDDASETQA